MNDPALPACATVPSGPTSASAAAAPPRIDSASLLGRSRELIIVHGSREYRLRITQNGKLILTA